MRTVRERLERLAHIQYVAILKNDASIETGCLSSSLQHVDMKQHRSGITEKVAAHGG